VTVCVKTSDTRSGHRNQTMRRGWEERQREWKEGWQTLPRRSIEESQREANNGVECSGRGSGGGRDILSGNEESVSGSGCTGNKSQRPVTISQRNPRISKGK